mgnify:CR=1 FL=1
MTELPPPSPGIGRDKEIRQLEVDFALTGEAPRVFSIIGDEAQWPESLEPRVLKRQPNERLIVALPDFTRIEFIIESTPTGSKVAILHDLIKTAEEHKAYRKIWTEWFDQIEKRVSL